MSAMLPDAEAPESIVKPLAGLHVLVVDDNEDTREVLRSMLVFMGAIVTTVGGGEAALDVLRTVYPNVVAVICRCRMRSGYCSFACWPCCAPVCRSIQPITNHGVPGFATGEPSLRGRLQRISKSARLPTVGHRDFEGRGRRRRVASPPFRRLSLPPSDQDCAGKARGQSVYTRVIPSRVILRSGGRHGRLGCQRHG